MQNEIPIDPFLSQLCEGYTELMMTKAKIETRSNGTLKNHIINLLEQLVLAYKKTRQERKELTLHSSISSEEFTILEEVELLTVNIRGYARQIQVRGWIDNEQQAIERLQVMQIFNIPVVAKFYFENNKYSQIKEYICMLDYLRLLMLEYLRSS